MKKVMGLDLGSKSLGISMSDPMKIIASAYENFIFEEDNYDIAINRVIEIINSVPIEKIILGLPKNMDNSIGHRAQICLDFKAKLAEKIDIEIVMVDERRTSKQAEAVLLEADVSRKNRKKHIDKIAATFILQSYLDTGA